MKLTFKYPVYPTKTQETTLFEWKPDHLCELQNSARHDRKVAWETESERVSCNEQQKKLTVAREKYADFRAVPQDMQVCALERMDKAFDGFYRRCKKGAGKKGYPRHRKRIRSMTWKLRKHRVKNKSTGEYERVRQTPISETSWKHDRLKVPKLGEVKIYMHRPLQGDPTQVTLVKKASGWYAHITCELPDTPKVEPTDAIAIDVGTTHYLFSLRSIPKAKKKITRVGIAKPKACCINTIRGWHAARKGASVGIKPCLCLPCTKNAPETNAKILSVNSSINSFIIKKTMSLSRKT